MGRALPQDGKLRGTGEALQGGGVDMAGDGIRRLVEEAIQRIVFAGWHQTEMAVGQG